MHKKRIFKFFRVSISAVLAFSMILDRLVQDLESHMHKKYRQRKRKANMWKKQLKLPMRTIWFGRKYQAGCHTSCVVLVI